MTEWFDRVDSSQTRILIAELTHLLPRLQQPSSSNELERQDRLRLVVEHLERRVTVTDPELVPPKTLSSAAPLLEAIRDALLSYLDTGDPGRLVAVNEAIDALLASSYFWVVTTESETDSARRAAIAYRRSVGQLLRAAEQDLDSTKRSMEAGAKAAEAALAQAQTDAESRIEAVRQAAEQTTEKMRTEAESAVRAVHEALSPLETRLATADQTIAEQKARLDTAIAAFQEQFSKAEASRTDTFTQTIARLTEANASFSRELEGRVSGEMQEIKAQAEQTVALIADHELDARKVLSALGREGVTGGHVKYANEQRTMANWWSIAAVAALIIIFGYGVWTLASRPTALIDWQWVLERILVAGSMLLIAIFAMVQSGRHRETERAARQAELDLAALDPYIALLPDTEQQKLKVTLAERAFFREPAHPDASGSVGIKDLIDLIRDAVKR